MSIRQLVIAITFMAIFAMAVRVSVDTDTWWHLRTGEWIIGNRSIPKTDSFSFTRAGDSWLYPSSAWVSEVKLFVIYDRLGAAGLNFFVAAAVTLAFGFVYLAMSGGYFLRAFTLVVAATASAVYWAARPYLSSFVLSAVFLWILEDFRWGRRNRLIWLPVLIIIWANSHPGFAVGFILLAIYVADEFMRWLAKKWKSRSGLKIKRRDLRNVLQGRLGAMVATGAAMLVAMLFNPSGPAIVRLPLETVSIGVLRDYIQEWQSPDFHQLNVMPFAILFFVTMATLAFSRQPIAVSDLLLVSVFGLMGLLAGRNIALFALAAPVVLTRHAAPILGELRKFMNIRPRKIKKSAKWQAIANLGILGVLFLAAAAKTASVIPAEVTQRVQAMHLPLGAVAYIQREHPEGNLFNSYNWGGYLIWTLRDYPVFVDGRTDLYSDELLSQWLNIVGAEKDWQTYLDAWGINLILLEPHWPLSKVLVENEDWNLLYQDEISVLYGR